MRPKTWIVLALLVGAAVGSGGTYLLTPLLKEWRNPRPAYLPDWMDLPTAQLQAAEWGQNVHFHHAYTGVVHDKKLVVYPEAARPSVGRDGVVLTVSIAVRPWTESLTIEQTRDLWKSTPLPERLDAYRRVCEGVVNRFTQYMQIDKTRVFSVHFAAGKVTPWHGATKNLAADRGIIKDGRITMTLEGGKLAASHPAASGPVR